LSANQAPPLTVLAGGQHPADGGIPLSFNALFENELGQVLTSCSRKFTACERAFHAHHGLFCAVAKAKPPASSRGRPAAIDGARVRALTLEVFAKDGHIMHMAGCVVQVNATGTLEGRPLARIWRVAISDKAKAKEIVGVITGAPPEEINVVADWPDHEMRNVSANPGDVKSE
jgi:hypothetical protein